MSKRWLLGLFACSVLALGTTSSRAEPARYVIDKDHFAIAFSVMHIGFSRVIGMFLEGESDMVLSYTTSPENVSDVTEA